jgi:hypothetical protein
MPSRRSLSDKVPFEFRLTSTEKDALRSSASEQKISMSEIVRRAFCSYADQQELADILLKIQSSTASMQARS